MGLLQGWLDIGAMVILSLLCFIWAGQTSLGFCLLTCTFISLISSGSGRTSNEFQPCSKPCPLAAIQTDVCCNGYLLIFTDKNILNWTYFNSDTFSIFISPIFLLLTSKFLWHRQNLNLNILRIKQWQINWENKFSF